MVNILLVENNTREAVYEHIVKHHKITIAKNTKELLTIKKQEPPELIILNIKPIKKRLEIYLKIKEDKETRNTPLIIIHDDNTLFPPHRVTEAYLQTPVTEQMILETIDKLSKKEPEAKNQIKILYIANPLEKEDVIKSNGTFVLERTNSPSSALKLIEESKHDCILLDYILLNIDGITFFKNIRGHTDIPVILYTDYIEEGIAEKAFEAGIDDFVRKEKDEVHIYQLIKRIHRAINARKLQKILIHSADMIANINDAIISIDTDYTITSWNKAAETLYGWSEEETVGKTIFEINFFDKPTHLELSYIFGKQKKWQGELVHKNREGKHINIYASSTCLTNKNGDIIGYVTVNRDITKEKKILQENAEYKKRLEALYRYSVRLDEAETKEEVYGITFEAIHEAIEAKYHEVKLVEGDCVKGIYPEQYKSTMPIDGPGITTRAVREKRSQLVNDVHNDPDYVMGKDWTDVYSELSVPVFIEGEPVAVINVEHEKEAAFTDQDKTILETFAISISNALV